MKQHRYKFSTTKTQDDDLLDPGSRKIPLQRIFEPSTARTQIRLFRTLYMLLKISFHREVDRV
jgi:hypothetical protein